jgi:hypothetical protein
VAKWQALLAHVRDRQPVDHGLRLRFGPAAPVTEIARLVAAERACCPFFAFAITVDDRGVALEVTAPAGGEAVLAELFGEAR